MADVIDEYLQARPAPALRSAIAFYSGYRQRNIAPALHRGLPSPYLTLIFTIDEPLTIVRHLDPDQAPASYDTVVGGLHTTPVLLRHDGRQSGVQVQLHPLAARRLLGLPAGEIAECDMPADVLLGTAVDEIRDGLHRAADWPARFAVIDRVLQRMSIDAAPVHDDVRWAWSRLLRTGGRIAVADLVAETGWSDRHLATLLRRETGLTPKRAARVVRFDRARRLLQEGGHPVAGIAADCGYVDQSHMSRDFVAMTGYPPLQWLARANDAPALIRFLVDVVGFEETVVYGEGDVVHHAQLDWPLGGGVMLGSVRPDGAAQHVSGPGTFSAYVVTDTPDELHTRVQAAGADITMNPHDTDYGSRDFALRDPEGNTWSFGTYRGEPRKTSSEKRRAAHPVNSPSRRRGDRVAADPRYAAGSAGVGVARSA